MRHAVLVFVLAVFTYAACKAVPSGSTIDRAAAQEVSDSFMADLVGNRVDDAVARMEPEFVTMLGRSGANAEIKKLFIYCGRPLDSEFKHDEIGFKIYLDGRRKPMRKFFYATTTDQNPKGVCFFTVSVVPGQTGLKVTEFGPLKLQSGELPVWLR